MVHTAPRCCNAPSSGLLAGRPPTSVQVRRRPAGAGSAPRERRSMLYQLYETQRALLSPFSEFASASAKLYNHPLSPFTHTPMAHRVAASLDLLHRLAKEYEKPAFDITSVRVEGTDVAVQQQVAIEKPFCRLLRFKRFTDHGPVLESMKKHPTVLVVAPLSGHHSTAAARDGAPTAAAPQGLHHRLDRRAHGAARGRPVPPRRLRRLRAGVHPPHRAGRQCHLGVPADGAGAGGGLADGEQRRGHAAHAHDDGRADRRPAAAPLPSTTWR